MTICAVVKTLRAGYDCEEELVKSLGFKVGDEVTLKEDISSIYLKHNKEYVVDKVFDDKLFVQGVDFKYDSKIFELAKEKNMKKFKVGDKVVRVSETYGKAIKGGVYEVSGVSDNGHFGSCGINLKGHEGVSGKFNYESSCFDLYDDNILSPLEAAEALMNRDNLQVFDSDDNKWNGFHNELRNITLEDLKHIKLRRKPKTVIINGVEVEAPVELPVGTKVWYPSVACKGLQKGSAGGGLSIYWLKEEDAQKALDAMLIPFKD